MGKDWRRWVRIGVRGDEAADGHALEVELQIHVLAEPRRVVVACRLGVAKSLHIQYHK